MTQDDKTQDTEQWWPGHLSPFSAYLARFSDPCDREHALVRIEQVLSDHKRWALARALQEPKPGEPGDYPRGQYHDPVQATLRHLERDQTWGRRTDRKYNPKYDGGKLYVKSRDPEYWDEENGNWQDVRIPTRAEHAPQLTVPTEAPISPATEAPHTLAEALEELCATPHAIARRIYDRDCKANTLLNMMKNPYSARAKTLASDVYRKTNELADALAQITGGYRNAEREVADELRRVEKMNPPDRNREHFVRNLLIKLQEGTGVACSFYYTLTGRNA
ncbi:hypothetical protein HY490_04755 [Candidatus Woesearchaeota archaeon]|nr:hypothetical protein [Candidatus Woesearchaeota archaeon]